FKIAVALLGAAALDDDVAPLDVAELTQPLAKGLRKRAIRGKRREISDPVHLCRRLRLDGKRRNGEVENENNREPDPPHGHLGLVGGQATQSRFDGLMMFISCSTEVRGPEMMRLFVA